jgi:hemolysin III
MLTLNRYLREPINSLTHLAGALVSITGCILLIILTWGQTTKVIALGIFGLSLVFLYTTSALYHGIYLPDKKIMWLNRLDHVAIFLLIAGTYTPIVAILFPPVWRTVILVVIWTATILGIIYKIVSKRIHGVINASLYLIISWAGAIPAILLSQLRPVFSTGGFRLILLGGLIYTAGFFIYIRKRPNPWPNIFGHHEIWHLFVLGGSLCHFLFMLFYIVPHQG